MVEHSKEDVPQSSNAVFIKLYPSGLLLLAVLANLLGFGVDPLSAGLPSEGNLEALILAAALLLINHTWLMISTSLVRDRHNVCSTPEEWAASGLNKEDISDEGWRELERCHNTHRNTTENTVYFMFLAVLFTFASGSTLATQVWITTFPIARLGYTYSYLSGKDNLRGLFMSLSLLSVYGMASYLVMGLFS
jgi:uncharacterized MAPEG superfamily protein